MEVWPDRQDGMHGGGMEDADSEVGSDTGTDDSSEASDVNSQEADGRDYVYPPEPVVAEPELEPRDLEYDAQLFEASYDYMAYFQEQHFARMRRIEGNLPGRNLPTTMPIWTLWENRLPVVGRAGFIQYRPPDELAGHGMDPMSASATGPCRTNEEGNIIMPGRHEYDTMWLRHMHDADTANVFHDVLTARGLDQEWRYDSGAPVDVEGYPLTQYYTQDDDTKKRTQHNKEIIFLIIL
jgi:hypothetical protein